MKHTRQIKDRSRGEVRRTKRLIRETERLLETHPHRALTLAELRSLLLDARLSAGAEDSTIQDLIATAEAAGLITKVELFFRKRPTTRFLVGKVSILDLIQAAHPKGYFSHFTAMHLNNLTEQIPAPVYFNIEQTRRSGGGELTQAGINRAFANKCRVTENTTNYQGKPIYFLNGANTSRLGVVEQVPSGVCSSVSITDIERTLIDATVRPIYSGGVFEVAKAYEMARDRASVNKLAAYLRKLNFTYPYHQAVGFYLERAGYDATQLKQIEEVPRDFDFFLDYGLNGTRLDKKWRLHVPKGF